MRRPSPALIVAVIALIVAMTGTSYAVTQLPRNSVGAPQIKKNAVTTAKIKTNAVTSAKIKNGTIATADLAPATRDALKGQKGDTGAQGAQGIPGPSVGGSVVAVPGTGVSTSVATLISLGTTATATSSGPVVVSSRSRLQITASVNLNKEAAQSASSGRVNCFAQWSVAGSGVWDDTNSVSLGSVTLGANSGGEDVWGTLSIDAFQTVDPGSYDVQLICQRLGAAIIADYAAINVVAIPAA